MFVLGLVIGPLIGLAVAYGLKTSISQAPAVRLAVSAVLVAALLVVPVAKIETRLGFAAGVLLGLLLAATPTTLPDEAD